MPVSAWCYYLHQCLQNYCQYFTILSWIQALDTRGLSSYSSFPGFSSFMGGIISHMLVLATPFSTVHNSKYLDPYHWSHISFSCLFLRQWCRDVASGADRHLDITFGLHLVESSSLVSVLFREAFNHPYISFFYVVVNGFSVTCFHTFLQTPYLLLIGGQYRRAGRN